MNNKILFIRFSSLGDIAQCLFTVDHWHEKFPQDEIHFLTKEEFVPLVQSHTHLKQVVSYNNKSGVKGLWQLACRLRNENYHIIYDAHNNLRSFILRILLFRFTKETIVRSKNRLRRFLLFQLKINTFENPFVGAKSFITPLKNYVTYKSNITTGFKPKDDLINNSHLAHFLNSNPSIQLKDVVLLAPSAAWELKRWPLEYWQSLSHLYKGPILILGGPSDNFCREIEKVDPKRIKSLAGKMTWLETASLINQSRLLVSGDTGALHLSDLLEKPNLAIIGPTAFGFTARPSSKVFKTHLKCQPCTKDGRGRCKNKEYKKCLLDIKPNDLFVYISQITNNSEIRNATP